MSSDVVASHTNLLEQALGMDFQQAVARLWEVNPELHDILGSAGSTEEARERVYAYLERAERKLLEKGCKLEALERSAVRDAVRVLRNLFAPIHEERTGVSDLELLWNMARGEDGVEVSYGFVLEFIQLFQTVGGHVDIYRSSSGRETPRFLELHGREAALERSRILDDLGRKMMAAFDKYKSGLDPEIIEARKEHRRRILDYFGATEEDWGSYRWHLKKVIRKAETLADLLELSDETRAAVAKAVEHHIPFGITPYYLSLMDPELGGGQDHAVRAQVIPPKDYVDALAAHMQDRGEVLDFMGEHDTSPIDLVTRRYPMIVIVKPYNTCAQICVYCQRNWEIDEVLSPKALSAPERLAAAIDWVREHDSIRDVLLTGGDPMIMSDRKIHSVLEDVARIEHVKRIRIGTRTPVVLPQRYTDDLLHILGEFHEPGRREVAIVTHFEHSYEITPEAMDAVTAIRRLGIGVYNQEVFSLENSRRFETVKLRVDLRAIGVDPYYNFNMKGKDETVQYRVPIARIIQERKEEARLLPGLDRTDEPVFNVPRLGKNHLRAMQDHQVIMIRPDGRRVYEMHPWEKNISLTPHYDHVDVPIAEYLERLLERGESYEDYRTIWSYY